MKLLLSLTIFFGIVFISWVWKDVVEMTRPNPRKISEGGSLGEGIKTKHY